MEQAPLITALIGWSIICAGTFWVTKDANTQIQRSQKLNLTPPLKFAGLVMAGASVALIYAPGNELINLAMVPVLIALGISQSIVLDQTTKKLKKAIHEHHLDTSVCGINLSLENSKGNTTHLQFWFKETGQEWPPTQLEIAVGDDSVPIHTIAPKTLDLLEPVITAAIEGPGCRAILREAQDKLIARGILHPIDIAGWDYTPVTKLFVESILRPKTNEI